MKRLISILLCLTVVFSVALAEDYAAMTVEDLYARRSELLDELTTVNTIIGEKTKSGDISVEDSLGKIKEVFPDEAVALTIRDSCGKVSIEQEIAQADLDRITHFSSKYGDVYDLTNIWLLRNVDFMSFFQDCAFMGTKLPDEMRSMTNLTYLAVTRGNLEEIPEWIGELVNLENLSFYRTSVSSVPASIGNLTKLKDLSFGQTNISELPDELGNLVNLKIFSIANTKVTKIPDSMWSLNLESIDLEGTPIK